MNEVEDIKKQIAKDEEEHERDFSKLSAIKKCSRCDGELDQGYIIMKRGSNWNENKPGFLKFSEIDKPLTWKNLSFPSLRCRKCHLVTFDYTSEVEKGTVKE